MERILGTCYINYTYTKFNCKCVEFEYSRIETDYIYYSYKGRIFLIKTGQNYSCGKTAIEI